MLNGKQLYMYKGYTYCRWFTTNTGEKWRCSTASSLGCKAIIQVSTDGKLLCNTGEHRHPPAKYFVTKSGFYIRSTERKRRNK